MQVSPGFSVTRSRVWEAPRPALSSSQAANLGGAGHLLLTAPQGGSFGKMGGYYCQGVDSGGKGTWGCPFRLRGAKFWKLLSIFLEGGKEVRSRSWSAAVLHQSHFPSLDDSHLPLTPAAQGDPLSQSINLSEVSALPGSCQCRDAPGRVAVFLQGAPTSGVEPSDEGPVLGISTV